MHDISIYSQEIHKNENRFLREIYMYIGKIWHLLSFASHSKHLAQFFNSIIQFLSCRLELSYKIPEDFFNIFYCVLKPDKREGAFQRRNLWIFSFYWINIVWNLECLWTSNNLENVLHKYLRTEYTWYYSEFLRCNF